MNARRLWSSRSLTVQVSLVLLAPLLLCLSLYGWGNVRLRRTEMRRDADREVRDLGTVVEVSLDAFLRDRHLDDLAELTEDLSRADRVLGVLVCDSRGRLVQRSRSVAAMEASLAPLARRALASAGPLEETLPLRGRGEVLAYAFAIRPDHGGAPRGAAVIARDLGYIDANLADSARRIALAGLALALVVTAGTTLGLRRAVVRPLGALVVHAERVAQGSLDQVVDLERRDEVGRLAAAFDRMLRSLRAARADLEAQHVAARSLERRLQHAQRLALIGQLSATVAHQVGSPLNVVLGRARYALQQGVDDPRVARHLAEIVAGAEQISGVIESLLTHARRVRGRAERVGLGELARATARFLEAECERQGVRVTLEVDDAVALEGSREELEQVMLNLAVNAIQAQPRGGALRIAVGARDRDDGPEAEVTVDDAGPGVPEAARARIFEPFFTTKTSPDGTGLGLSICDEIVRRHGGTLRVEGSPFGGARFVVRLPLGGARRRLDSKAPS